ncbi:hypothetical protein [Pseudodesulfovibrio karagichevae]|uniref:Uncharacterized protein n=1 Tax=Pseudodesulfovibrio karagichevae TaxID=3239305 RepID=A0ABV4K435_9BACT
MGKNVKRAAQKVELSMLAIICAGFTIFGGLIASFMLYPVVVDIPNKEEVKTLKNRIAELEEASRKYNIELKQCENVREELSQAKENLNTCSKINPNDYATEANFTPTSSEQLLLSSGQELILNDSTNILHVSECYTTGGMDMKTPYVKGFIYSLQKGPRKDFSLTIGDSFFYNEFRIVPINITDHKANLVVTRGRI